MQLNKQRRKDRKICLQVLYSNVVAGVDIEAVLSGTATMPYIEDIDDYASNLIRGTFSNQDSIDEIISKAAKNWSLGRMPVIDKCLLRQTIFEMMYVDDVPISVSINEAVELAKEFGGEDDSHKYVNGVLGKIARDMESK